MLFYTLFIQNVVNYATFLEISSVAKQTLAIIMKMVNLKLSELSMGQRKKIALAGVHVVSATCMFCLLQLCKTFSRSKSLKRNSLTKVSLLKSTTFNPAKLIHMGMRDKLHANG